MGQTIIKPKQIEPIILKDVSTTSGLLANTAIDISTGNVPSEPLGYNTIYGILGDSVSTTSEDVVINGYTKAVAGGTISKGDLLVSATYGYVQPVSGTTTRRILGIALEDAVQYDVMKILVTNHFQNVSAGSGGGAENFLDLTDTPSAYPTTYTGSLLTTDTTTGESLVFNTDMRLYSGDMYFNLPVVLNDTTELRHGSTIKGNVSIENNATDNGDLTLVDGDLNITYGKLVLDNPMSTSRIDGNITFEANAQTEFKNFVKFTGTGSNFAWFYGAVPGCSNLPTSGYHLTNKTYVDSVAGGSTILKETLNSTTTSWTPSISAGEHEITIDATDLEFNSSLSHRIELLINGEVEEIVTKGNKETFTKNASSITTRIRGMHIDDITYLTGFGTSYTTITDVCVRGNYVYITADDKVYEWNTTNYDDLSTASNSGNYFSGTYGAIVSFFMSKDGIRFYTLEDSGTTLFIVGYYLPSPFDLSNRPALFSFIYDTSYTFGDACIRLSEDLTKVYNSFSHGKLLSSCLCNPGDLGSIVKDFYWNPNVNQMARKFHINRDIILSCDHLLYSSSTTTYYYPLLENWVPAPFGRNDTISNSMDAVWFDDVYIYFVDNGINGVRQYSIDNNTTAPTGEARIIIK